GLCHTIRISVDAAADNAQSSNEKQDQQPSPTAGKLKPVKGRQRTEQKFSFLGQRLSDPALYDSRHEEQFGAAGE
ncbi:MAG TPA: hypothetical protein VF511_00395, partial [Chthoniobacterales bacterium]